jgi:hypothetical protein
MSWLWLLILELEIIIYSDIKWNNYFIINEGWIFLLDLVQNWQIFLYVAFSNFEDFDFSFRFKSSVQLSKTNP